MEEKKQKKVIMINDTFSTGQVESNDNNDLKYRKDINEDGDHYESSDSESKLQYFTE